MIESFLFLAGYCDDPGKCLAALGGALNQYNGDVTAGGTAILAVVTGAYVWLTNGLAHASSDQAKAALRQLELGYQPYVTVIPQFDGSHGNVLPATVVNNSPADGLSLSGLRRRSRTWRRDMVVRQWDRAGSAGQTRCRPGRTARGMACE